MNNIEPLSIEELESLVKKVKQGIATNEEIISYLDTVNGLLDEFLAALKSMPKDTNNAAE